MQFRIAKSLNENGIVVGNVYDKYGSRNPIVKKIMQGFSESLEGLVSISAPSSINEIGCGEGYWSLCWHQRGYSVRGSDFSTSVIEIARENARQKGLNPRMFESKNIYDLTPDVDTADLIVCCEVLEHLERPHQALLVLQKIVTRHIILSVPREPIWRLLNMMRGKYVTAFGNTPGHIQHWSKISFLSLVETYFDIVEVRSPLPWTMVLCKPRNNNETDS